MADGTKELLVEIRTDQVEPATPAAGSVLSASKFAELSAQLPPEVTLGMAGLYLEISVAPVVRALVLTSTMMAHELTLS